VEEGLAPNPEKKMAVLRARATALAQEPRKENAAVKQIEIVEFLLAHERYGIEASFVREVYPLREFTPIPGTPPFVLGIINLRGEIISVVDIKKFFDLPEKGITDLNKVIVLQNATMEFGILADAVPGARLISLDELQPPPRTFTGVREEYLRGITVERLAVLDARKLLSDSKLVIQEEIETPTKDPS
jgi:purine-binding chemotaxis protein CheW